MSIPAAQYLRKSTDLQQYSIENQEAAIRQYAQRNGFFIVKTYVDSARSGVLLKLRGGLTTLLTDVLKGNANYAAILVYDVSRWGRFLDADESAHYEFLCKNAGIPVHYCAELFPNDGTLPSSIFKALKRTMAAEYSRELSIKVFGAQKRLALLGFRMGGAPGYGFRRLLIRADQKHTQQLQTGERKSLAMDRVVLVPGPRREVECVKKIFAMAIRNKTMSEIARELNKNHVWYVGGREWDCAAVGRILRNEKYTGCLVWHRRTAKLHSRPTDVPPEDRITVPGAFAPLIDQTIFERAQEVTQKRLMKTTNEEMLKSLRKLLERKGKLTENIIRDAPDAPSVSMCHCRLGPLREVYKSVGYEVPPGTFSRIESKNQTVRIRREILAQIAELFPGRTNFVCLPQRHRHIIHFDNSLAISLLICRSHQSLWRGLRWKIVPAKYECDYITLLARLNKENDGVDCFFLFPRIEPDRWRILSVNDPWWNKGKPIELWQLYGCSKELLQGKAA